MSQSRRFTFWHVICAILTAYILYLNYLNYVVPIPPSNDGSGESGEMCEKLFLPIMEPSEISNFSQNDPILLNYLRARHISPPSKLPYHFASARYIPGGDEKMARMVQKIFNVKRGGFFVEVGAFDGVGSNTLFLESGYKWSGILIECQPKLIPELRRANRKSYIADVCISTSEKSSVVEFVSARAEFNKYPGSSSLLDSFFKRTNQTVDRFNVTTVPLYSLLAAIEVNVVDFFVLDVQGIELKVLRAFPFHLISVKVWAIEHSEHNEMEKKEIVEIMGLNGYPKPVDLGGDYLFIHQSVKTKI